jgi:hypothetical protein
VQPVEVALSLLGGVEGRYLDAQPAEVLRVEEGLLQLPHQCPDDGLFADPVLGAVPPAEAEVAPADVSALPLLRQADEGTPAVPADEQLAQDEVATVGAGGGLRLVALQPGLHALRGSQRRA